MIKEAPSVYSSPASKCQQKSTLHNLPTYQQSSTLYHPAVSTSSYVVQSNAIGYVVSKATCAEKVFEGGGIRTSYSTNFQVESLTNTASEVHRKQQNMYPGIHVENTKTVDAALQTTSNATSSLGMFEYWIPTTKTHDNVNTTPSIVATTITTRSNVAQTSTHSTTFYVKPQQNFSFKQSSTTKLKICSPIPHSSIHKVAEQSSVIKNSVVVKKSKGRSKKSISPSAVVKKNIQKNLQIGSNLNNQIEKSTKSVK